MKMASFEKLKSDLNQTWFIDIIWKHAYIHVVKRSQIKVKGHLRSTCKITHILEDQLELP